jgi:hypothetical protein
MGFTSNFVGLPPTFLNDLDISLDRLIAITFVAAIARGVVPGLERIRNQAIPGSASSLPLGAPVALLRSCDRAGWN